MAWVGIEDDEVVIGTLPDQAKLQNLRADPRIAISFEAPGKNAYGLDHYLVLRGRAPGSPRVAPPSCSSASPMSTSGLTSSSRRCRTRRPAM